MIILLIFALLAGVATVLSPCILPILPAVLSSSVGGKLRPLAVVTGLIVSFSFFTLALTSIVKALGFNPNILRDIAIAAIFLFGLTLSSTYLSDIFARLTSVATRWGGRLQQKAGSRSDIFGGLLLGVSLGLVWTPCAGPILASITTLALTGNLTLTAISLCIAYGLGAGVSMLFLTYSGQRILTIATLAPHTETIRRVFGVIMITTAVLMAFNVDRLFSAIALQHLPSLLPDTANVVQQELDRLTHGNSLSSGTLIDKITAPTEFGMVLPDLGPAPEFVGLTGWINTDPITLASLKGKVVLVDFWTYSCINCIRTFPYLKQWYSDYAEKGFVIVGVHSPEFEFEKDHGNVVSAVQMFGIKYPVAQDNDYGTWNAYGNHYWPAHYLIDRNGHIRQIHNGEGAYVETENDIRSLLGLGPKIATEPAGFTKPQTPEIYLGSTRAQNYTGSLTPALKPDTAAVYNFTPPLDKDEVGLSGPWLVTKEYIVPDKQTAIVALNFTAGKVHAVLGGKSTTPITVLLDGKPIPANYQSPDYINGKLLVSSDREYTVVDLKGGYGTHVLQMNIPTGVSLYTFTFGQ